MCICAQCLVTESRVVNNYGIFNSENDLPIL